MESAKIKFWITTIHTVIANYGLEASATLTCELFGVDGAKTPGLFAAQLRQTRTTLFPEDDDLTRPVEHLSQNTPPHILQ